MVIFNPLALVRFLLMLFKRQHLIQSFLELSNVDIGSSFASATGLFDPSKMEGSTFFELIEDAKKKTESVRSTLDTLQKENQTLKEQVDSVNTERQKLTEAVLQLKKTVRQEQGIHDLDKREVEFLKKQLVRRDSSSSDSHQD